VRKPCSERQKWAGCDGAVIAVNRIRFRAAPPMPTNTHSRPPAVGDRRIPSASEKAAATRRRRKDDERGDKLTQIRAQVADGSLVIRQMTDAEHQTALKAASHSLRKNDKRLKRYRALIKT
jgi:hypothetical protein